MSDINLQEAAQMAERTLKAIYDFDVKGFTPVEISSVIDCLMVILKARAQAKKEEI